MKDLNVPDRTASEKFSYMRKTMAHKEKKIDLELESCKIFRLLLSFFRLTHILPSAYYLKSNTNEQKLGTHKNRIKRGFSRLIF